MWWYEFIEQTEERYEVHGTGNGTAMPQRGTVTEDDRHKATQKGGAIALYLLQRLLLIFLFLGFTKMKHSSNRYNMTIHFM